MRLRRVSVGLCGVVAVLVGALAACDRGHPAAAQAAPAEIGVAAAPEAAVTPGQAAKPDASERRSATAALEVRADEAGEPEAARYATAVGSLRARRMTRVGPQVAGRVQEVLVEVGDSVQEGQVVVRLDPVLFEIELAQSQATAEAARGALAAAAADTEQKQRELERQADLLARGSGSPKDHDDALASHAQAAGTQAEKAGKLAEAEQRVRWARQRLDETQVRAPYGGAVTARLVDPGEPASAAPVTHLLEIQEVQRLYLEFSLPQELLADVHPGAALEFEMEGRDRREGQVDVIFPAIDEATRSFRCRAEIDNTDGSLAPGLLVRVRVAREVGREVAGNAGVAGAPRAGPDSSSLRSSE